LPYSLAGLLLGFEIGGVKAALIQNVLSQTWSTPFAFTQRMHYEKLRTTLPGGRIK
jgi:hypothetical protein